MANPARNVVNKTSACKLVCKSMQVIDAKIVVRCVSSEITPSAFQRGEQVRMRLHKYLLA